MIPPRATTMMVARFRWTMNWTKTWRTGLQKSKRSQRKRRLIPTDEEEDDDDPRPRNFHAAIIGDSVSRYQYMTLGFFLHHGRHPSKAAGDRGPILSQYNDDIYEFKNTYLLEPHGVCDCFRTVKWKPSAFCENRYFYDPVRNNSLTYLLKYGHADVQGHWKPDQVHDNSHQIHVSSEEDDRYAWKGNWTVALRHLAALVPKPEYVIFNAGHHPNNFNQSNVQEEIANTLHELDMVGVYKTSTCERGGTPSKYAAHEQDENQRQALCQRFHCLEYDTWTCHELDETAYYDQMHLQLPANQRMNEQLLEEWRNGELRRRPPSFL